MAARDKTGDLTTGKVWKTIPAFVFPLLIGNVMLQMYNLVDSVIVGNFLGKEALAAVSASFFIYYFVISLIIGVGSGITVVIAQYFGAGRYDDVQRAFSSILIFTVIAGVLLSVVGIALAEPLFRLTKTPEDVVPLAVRYFRVYIGGTFIFITLNSLLSTFRGMGDSRRPMVFILITAVLNVVLDVLFIIVFRFGVEGAAYATVLAQASGVVVAMVYLRSCHPLLSLRRRDLKFDYALFRRGLKIGLPVSIQQCSLSVGLLALLGVVNVFGTDTLTAYGAAGKIDSLITQAILTLSSAISAFCGQNIGAGRFSRVSQGVRFAMVINVFFSLTVFAMIFFFGHWIMKVFTPDPAVISIGYEYLLTVGAVFVLNGATNVMNGAMRGAGDTLFAMINGIVSLWLIRIPLAYILGDSLGYQGVWWAISISLVFGFITTLIYYVSGRWKRRMIIC
ncbi:MAG: MATE family efflux transporter [Tannerella sp.]|jgi:putative MATE family efflux protein|nr:MATE family efflux transporter [Tannerella sp.]